ncbi:MAG: methylmalonyl-CoA epimerase [Elusimicrobia bacterium]|nr:methylmalonyl-CoA epimerase [Elusimicrobiota bacterium]
MKIDHIGVAVRSLDEAASFYKANLGLAEVHREEVPGQKVRVAFLSDPADPNGTAVELLEPTSPDGAVAKFISARGLGLHHLAFHAGGEPGAVATAMERMLKEGIPSLEPKPRPGARGHHVCFFHPKHCAGVLIELVGGG